MIYETPDVNLAAALRCLGHTLVGVRQDGSKGYFQFQLEAVEHAVTEYVKGRLSLEPNEFTAQQRLMRGLVRRSA